MVLKLEGVHPYNRNNVQINGKIKHSSDNKNFSVYGSANNLSDAIKIANELHKHKNKNNELNKNFNEDIDKNEINRSYEFTDEELKKRIEISEKNNKLFKETLNESSSINDILNCIVSNILDNEGEE